MYKKKVILLNTRLICLLVIIVVVKLLTCLRCLQMQMSVGWLSYESKGALVQIWSDSLLP